MALIVDGGHGRVCDEANVGMTAPAKLADVTRNCRRFINHSGRDESIVDRRSGAAAQQSCRDSVMVGISDAQAGMNERAGSLPVSLSISSNNMATEKATGCDDGRESLNPRFEEARYRRFRSTFSVN